MQTHFSERQLSDPATAACESVIRKCVHCGFCLATCPTYVLLGDERDSPRGRIYLMKQMLETESAPTAAVVKHVDRCLSCLSCMTTCPSGVHYMHLVDHARAYIEARYRRPLPERLLRALVARTLPYPARFRFALKLAGWVQPLARLANRFDALKPVAAMLSLAKRPTTTTQGPMGRASPAPHSDGAAASSGLSAQTTAASLSTFPRAHGGRVVLATPPSSTAPVAHGDRAVLATPPSSTSPGAHGDRVVLSTTPSSSTSPGAHRGRVVLLQGCVESTLRPQIRQATVRLLTRLGFEVAFAPNEGCCGALVHHMGREAESLAAARRNVDAWTRELEGKGLNAIIITASGCGTTIKDYGFMLRDDPAYAAKAARVSALARDISEWLDATGLHTPATAATDGNANELANFASARPLTVAYHSACSMQHGQKITTAPVRLLTQAGFIVRQPAESHLCCGSAGTYNIFQSGLATQLGDRKVQQLARLNPDVIATGNVGCAIQIGARTGLPVVHTVELLDWATGGPSPVTLRSNPRDSDKTRDGP
jgi:glycolate oxidase iron-sulfur subunit